MTNKGPQGRLGATDSGLRPGGFPLAPRSPERLPGPCWMPGETRKAEGSCLSLSASGAATGRAVGPGNALAQCPRLAHSQYAGASCEAGGFRAGFA